VTDPAKLARLRHIFRPEMFARPEDQERAERLGKGYSGPMPCEYEKIELGNRVLASLPTDQCYKMTPPQRMTGLWSDAFEASEFCPAPAQQCPDESAKRVADPYPRLYGNFEPPSLPGAKDTPPGGLYAVDFIGRRTEYAPSGGTSEADKIVVADRMISIKEIKPPPAQPTKAQMIAYFKACEANHTCAPNWDEIKAEDDAQMERAHVEGYFKDCAGKVICMPNSWAEKWRKQHPGQVK